MGIEYNLRGHHLRLLQLYLEGRNGDIKQCEFFDRVFSSKENKIRIIDSNDIFCDDCPYVNNDHCVLGEQSIRKTIVAKRDTYLAQNVFGLNIGDSYLILNIIEKLIPPFYLTGISAENFLQLKAPNNL